MSPPPNVEPVTGHAVTTAFERAWSNLENGHLIHAAETEGLAALIKTDQDPSTSITSTGDDSPSSSRRRPVGQRFRSTWRRFPPRSARSNRARIVGRIAASEPGSRLDGCCGSMIHTSTKTRRWPTPNQPEHQPPRWFGATTGVLRNPRHVARRAGSLNSSAAGLARNPIRESH